MHKGRGNFVRSLLKTPNKTRNNLIGKQHASKAFKAQNICLNTCIYNKLKHALGSRSLEADKIFLRFS